MTIHKRIGPKMALAVAIVRDYPGCTKKFVAERITPCLHPSANWAYGYEPVNRAIGAGLITYVRLANRYVLTIAE